jgi:hypothetical protein
MIGTHGIGKEKEPARYRRYEMREKKKGAREVETGRPFSEQS